MIRLLGPDAESLVASSVGKASRTLLCGYRAPMMNSDPRPVSSAPLDGSPVRLFLSAGSVIASFWSAERAWKAFGPGDYRAGWYLLDDDAIELDDPIGWEH